MQKSCMTGQYNKKHKRVVSEMDSWTVTIHHFLALEKGELHLPAKMLHEELQDCESNRGKLVEEFWHCFQKIFLAFTWKQNPECCQLYNQVWNMTEATLTRHIGHR